VERKFPHESSIGGKEPGNVFIFFRFRRKIARSPAVSRHDLLRDHPDISPFIVPERYRAIKHLFIRINSALFIKYLFKTDIVRGVFTGSLRTRFMI
jgi:hypothetical protein